MEMAMEMEMELDGDESLATPGGGANPVNPVILSCSFVSSPYRDVLFLYFPGLLSRPWFLKLPTI